MTAKILIIVLPLFFLSLVFCKKLIAYLQQDTLFSRRLFVSLMGVSGAVFFYVLFVLVCLPLNKNWGILSVDDLLEYNGIWLYGVPFSIFALLLGIYDSYRLIIKKAQKTLPITILSGFLIGCSVPILFALIDLAPMAYAGIPLHMEARLWTYGEWIDFFLYTIKTSIAAGSLGAFTGLFVGSCNRLILHYILKQQN